MLAKTPFLLLCLCFSLGILVSASIDIAPGSVALGFALLPLAALAYAFRRQHLPVFLLLSLVILMGFLRHEYWKQAHLRQPHQHFLPLRSDTLTVMLHSLEKRSRLRAEAELREIVRNGRRALLAGRIVLDFPYRYDESLEPGQILIITDAMLELPPGPRNPGQFDYRRYLEGQGIAAVCRVSDPRQIGMAGHGGNFSPEYRLFYPLRRKLQQIIHRHLPEPGAGFLQALLLGVRSGLSPGTREDFQHAGVMHVLAISGLHVGFVAVIFHLLLSFLPLYFKTRNWLIMVLLLGYMFLTGATPPVVRATLMGCFYFLAINLERRGSVYNYLFAAGFLILLCQPQQLFWVGFQFSFTAVLSIVYFYRKLQPPAAAVLRRIRKAPLRWRLEKWLMAPFLVSLAAQIGTLPLAVHYFQLFSLVAFFLNLIVIPLVGVIVSAGFLFLLLGMLSTVLAGILAAFLDLLIRLLVLLVQQAAALPFAYLHILHFGWMEMAVYFSLIFLLLYWRRRPLRTVFSVISLVGMMLAAALQWGGDPALDLIVIDVGQGDSALLTTPRGKSVLIDTGPASRYGNAADAAIIPVLRRLGRRKIDYLFISHPHLDHLGGTFRLLRYAAVDSVFLPPTPPGFHWNDTLLQVLQERQIPHRLLNAGERVIIDGETRIYVLNPLPAGLDSIAAPGHDLNNHSLVLLCKHRDQTILFTGDAETEAEHLLLGWGDILRSEVLKVGHHGSITSSGSEFLARIRPRYATVSVGKKNRFKHPSPQVIRRLQQSGARVLRTDRDAAVWLRCRDGRWEQVQWKH